MSELDIMLGLLSKWEFEDSKFELCDSAVNEEEEGKCIVLKQGEEDSQQQVFIFFDKEGHILAG